MLRVGEGKPRRECIHFIKKTDTTEDPIKESIRQWMITKDIDAVIWTGLPCKFYGVDFVRYTIDQVIDYLSNIVEPDIKKLAEEYIRKAPKQIDTDYRRAIEKALQWYPIT